MATNGRRLMFHGVLLFLLSLFWGSLVPLLGNPRIGLSAHVGGLMSGTFLVVLGLLWPRLVLGERARQIARFSGLYGLYGATAGFALASMLSTGRSTPINGVQGAALWREMLVDGVLVSSSIATYAACGIVLYGLRGPQDPA